MHRTIMEDVVHVRERKLTFAPSQSPSLDVAARAPHEQGADEDEAHVAAARKSPRWRRASWRVRRKLREQAPSQQHDELNLTRCFSPARITHPRCLRPPPALSGTACTSVSPVSCTACTFARSCVRIRTHRACKSACSVCSARTVRAHVHAVRDRGIGREGGVRSVHR